MKTLNTKTLFVFVISFFLLGAFSLSSAEAAGSITTKPRSCELHKTKDSVWKFKIKFTGYKKGNVFRVQIVHYWFDSRYEDKSNINIFNGKGKKIWRSPDSMKATGSWRRYRFKKERSIPLGRLIKIHAWADQRGSLLIDAPDNHCPIEMRIS